jgi:ParB family chromosome partitioning protein
LISAIGAAPSVGRDRWMKLAELLADADPEAAISAARGDTSDARFDAVLTALTPVKKPPAPPVQRTLTGADGQELGQVKRGPNKAVLTLNTKQTDGFEDWLIDNIQDLHSRWKSQVTTQAG